MSQLINRIRYYHYVSHVLEGQQTDPLCGVCRAFANTTARIQEGLAELECSQAAEIKALPADVLHLLNEARSKLAVIKLPKDAVGQKKARNCKMPEGVCFIKISKAILENI